MTASQLVLEASERKKRTLGLRCAGRGLALTSLCPTLDEDCSSEGLAREWKLLLDLKSRSSSGEVTTEKDEVEVLLMVQTSLLDPVDTATPLPWLHDSLGRQLVGCGALRISLWLERP